MQNITSKLFGETKWMSDFLILDSIKSQSCQTEALSDWLPDKRLNQIGSKSTQGPAVDIVDNECYEYSYNMFPLICMFRLNCRFSEETKHGYFFILFCCCFCFAFFVILSDDMIIFQFLLVVVFLNYFNIISSDDKMCFKKKLSCNITLRGISLNEKTMSPIGDFYQRMQ